MLLVTCFTYILYGIMVACEVKKLCNVLSFLNRRSCETPKLQHALEWGDGGFALTMLRFGEISVL